MKEALEKYNRLLIEKNKVMNLTAHKTESASFKYNIEDSLLFMEYFKNLKGSLLDIGSGGGCPAIPLKIALPHLDITMIDSLNKKVEFLNTVTTDLNLQKIRAIHTRVEDYANLKRESFDIVTARAVAELPTLLEYALPFLKIGGTFLAFKGNNYQAEIDKSTAALKTLGAEITEIKTASLDSEITRSLIIIKKLRPTDKKYPRSKNLPRLKPLV